MRAYSFNGQSLQDKFVLEILNYKRNGTFVEIGSNEPMLINNTYILEKEFDWTGLMVEYETKFLDSYLKERPNSYHVIDDATQIDYSKIFEQANLPNNIDYLQIDLEVNNGSTLKTLEKLNETVMDEFKFAVVTFEHDFYRGNFHNTRKKSREIFLNRGYVLAFPDVRHENNIYEDWYVHPDLINQELLKKIQGAKSMEYSLIFNFFK